MPHKILPLLAFTLLTTALALFGQTKQPSPSAQPSPPAQPVPSASPSASVTPKPRQLSPQQEQKIQEIAQKIQERTGNAANKVLGAIQKEEGDVYLKFVYFLKPERLDPNSYGSKQDILTWQKLLQELKDKETALETAYSNADIDLGTALIKEQISPPAAMQIKKTLLASFPWDTIKTKGQLMHEFLDEHGDLLRFYDENWGTWKPGPQPNTATFDNPDLSKKYQGLRDKITSTSSRLKEKYSALVQ